MSITFTEHAQRERSEKVLLVTLDASYRVQGNWVTQSSNRWYIDGQDFEYLISVENNGVVYTDAAAPISSTNPTLVDGEYYYNRLLKRLWIRDDSTDNPNSRFIVVTFRNFYSNAGVAAPRDLNQNGEEVYWLPYIKDDSSISDFKTELDTANQLGVALEGTGSVALINDRSYWASRFDKWVWDNKNAAIYAWNRDLPISEARTLFLGQISARSYSADRVAFSLKDRLQKLRTEVPMPLLSELTTDRVPASLNDAYQRRIYGFVRGFRPTNVDQIVKGNVEGYPIQGLTTAVNNLTTVFGASTLFLSEVAPGDSVRFTETGPFYSVNSVTNNNEFELTEPYLGQSTTNVKCLLRPGRAKRYINRKFVIAHHPLKKYSTTIANVNTASRFTVVDGTGFKSGDPVVVDGEDAVTRTVSGNYIALTNTLSVTPNAGDVVTRATVSNVTLDGTPLVRGRDFTVSDTTSPSRIELTKDAEFNISTVRVLRGTSLTFTTGSRIVTGVGTFFNSDLKIGDWIVLTNQSDYRQILSIESETSLTLTDISLYTGTATAYYRSPNYYQEGQSQLVCDVYGITLNDTSTGEEIISAPNVLKDLLQDAGLGSSLDASSFSTGLDLNQHRLGIAIPVRFSDKKAPTIRQIINEVNQSTFSSVVQNPDFSISYRFLNPSKPSDIEQFFEHDTLGVDIKLDSNKIVGTVNLNWDRRETNATNRAASSALEIFQSKIAQYLTKVDTTRTIDTWLVDEYSARIMASRWALVLELASVLTTIRSKLQTYDLSVTDKVLLNYSKLFERTGTLLNVALGAVDSISKNGFDSSVEINDLAGVFARCGTITENDQLSYALSGSFERFINGYITDEYGLIDLDSETAGKNIIF